MIINQSSIDSLFKGYSASFKQGFDGAETQYRKVAMVVPSSTRENLYAWLGQFPKVREWIGDRFVNNLSVNSYAVVNRDFENTVSVDRNDIQDDQFGVYGPMMEEMGKSAAELPDELIFGLVKAGFAARCYDGQNFFDTDHPVINEIGFQVSVSNTDGGAGPAWFLLDTNRAMKPFLYQERQPFRFASLDKDNGENAFFRKKYVYGCDGRSNAAYGFWQLAFGSRQPLDAQHYAAARRRMMEMRGDGGRLLGIRPNILVVPPGLEEDGRKLLSNDLIGNVVEGSGDNPVAFAATNPWKGTAELLVSPWVA